MIALVERVDTYTVADDVSAVTKHLHPDIVPGKVKVTLGMSDDGVFGPVSVTILGTMPDGAGDDMPGRDRAHFWRADDVSNAPDVARRALVASMAQARREGS